MALKPLVCPVCGRTEPRPNPPLERVVIYTAPRAETVVIAGRTYNLAAGDVVTVPAEAIQP